MGLLLWILLINTAAHLFLFRFFKWLSEDEDGELKSHGINLHNKWFLIILFIPPLAFILAFILLFIGAILTVADKAKKKKK